MSVLIVSIFGRGHWLASELARRNIPTTMIDASDSMGRWTPDDWEGPFGYFRTEKLKPTQLERLIEDEAQISNSNGFTLLHKSGPLEFQGPFFQYRLNALQSENFWFDNFINKYSSNSFFDHATSQQLHTPNVFGETYLQRQASRPGFEKSLSWCKSSGVKVLDKSEVIDISLGKSNTVSGVEIKSTQSGIIKAEQIVWMLSSEETYFISSKIGRHIYPKGAIEPQWAWMRFRLKLAPCFEREQLPAHSLVINEMEFSWSHENYMILRKTFSSDLYDLWIMVPNTQRFHKQYLMELVQKSLSILNKRAPSLKCELSEFPQEYHYTFEQMGPSRFPIFGYKQLDRLMPKRFNNLYFDGPEYWSHYTWNGIYKHQDAIDTSITLWWKKLQEEIERKKKSRD